MHAWQWKSAATLAAAIPALLFLFFALSATAGRSAHIVEALMLVGLIILGWYRPHIAAVALMVLGLVVEILFAVFTHQIQLAATLGVLILFIAPMIVSGLLFFMAHRRERALFTH